MKKRTPREPLAWLNVLVPGCIGLVVVGRTLGAYWPNDPIASAIVAAIGVGLAIGLIELLVRQQRAVQLLGEVRQLPASPSEATVDGASPLLSALLRARIEQVPSPGLGDSVAPYLTGLLVMLGLLGTLLGLFETVHGASQALTTSLDVNALRRSLTTPIAGLTRSFGCSAAGISASAMLGLALALVRRREGRLLRAVHAYSTGPLRVLAPLRRQARALEQLASQGLALPEASGALEQVAAQLGGLADRLVALQQNSLASHGESLKELIGGIRGELERVAADAGAALHERVAPLVHDVIARTGEAVQEQAATLARTTAEITRQLEAQAAALHGQAGELVTMLGARIGEAESERREAQRRELEALTALANQTVAAAEARDRALEARWSALSARVEESARALRDEESERLTRLDALTTRIGTDLGQLAATVGTDLGKLSTSVGAELSQLSTGVAADLGRLATNLEAQLTQRVESERAHSERSEGAMARIERSAALLESSLGRQGELLEASVARQAEMLEGSIGRQGQLLEAGIARQSELLETNIAHQGELLETNIGRQGEVLEGSIGRQGQMLEGTIARQGEALQALIERVNGLFRDFAASAQEGAQATLAALTERAAEQAERFAALEAALERSRAEQAQGLAQQLTGHAQQLEQRLAQTSAVVQEAAAAWRASSVEMQAVAEQFATGVERQREASDAWLASLGEMEGAVERAGRHAAADALSDQLSSTQEVFARQLQFQRELFEQLRSLRHATPRHGHGEQDVSV